MPRAMGTCSCGNEFIKVNRVRKSCLECQIIRDTNFSPKKQVNCLKCKRQFAPIKATYVICPECRGDESAEKYAPCKFCKRHIRTAPGLSSVCISCVSKNPAERMRYVVKLEQLKADRMQPAGPSPDGPMV